MASFRGGGDGREVLVGLLGGGDLDDGLPVDLTQDVVAQQLVLKIGKLKKMAIQQKSKRR